MDNAIEQDEMKEIINDFIVETRESIESLDQNFIELEKSPDNLDLINGIFRTFHTVKGASGFLGFQELVDVAHKAEDLLNKLRKQEIKLSSSIMDVVLEAVDIIKVMLGQIEKGEKIQVDYSGIIGRLEAVLNPKDSSREDAGNEKNKLGEILVEEEAISSKDLEKALNEQKEIKLPLGEILIQSNLINEDQLSGALAKQTSKAQTAASDQTIRVDIQRLDNVMNLVGELVIGRNRLLKINKQMEEIYGGSPILSTLRETTGHLDLVITDLQLAVMKTRMLPIGKVFNKFPRMVRDLSKSKGKDISLEIYGHETEIDKSVIEEIGDPLIHLIRNSIDHGIEAPEERIKRGKPRCGKIILRAYHEGNHIILEIEDDGKGMDEKVILEKAIKKGIITAVDAARMSKKEIINLIFTSGFSTAEEVSEISGRGVGMDVVRTNILKLNGSIEIDSSVGCGSKIALKLPLTVAIIQALMVSLNSDIFAIPFASVNETIRINPKDIRTIDCKEVISLRGSVIPIVRLDKEFDIASHIDEMEWRYIVVVSVEGKRYGLLVEGLRGKEEIVIKSLSDYSSGLKGIAGATISGDGKVVLILDVNMMINYLINRSNLNGSFLFH